MKTTYVTALRALTLTLCIVFSGSSAVARDWCASDCISLCKKTAAAAGWQACVEKFQCTTRPSSPCAGPARVAQRAAEYRAANPKGGATRMTFDACLQRGVRAGWGAAETSAYCQWLRR